MMEDITFLSWVELETVLRRLEARTPCPDTIIFKREHFTNPEKEHRVSVRSHFRYKDYTTLHAYCTTEEERRE